MEVIYNQELKYNIVCEMMGDLPKPGGRGRYLQLVKWQKNYDIEQSSRGKYTIKRELSEEEKLERSKKVDYSEWVKDFAKAHYITILSDLEGANCKSKIKYECKFHPGITQESRADNLVRSIGCPLCIYSMSRFEVMLFLGTKGALHKNRLDGVEYDLLLPDKKIAVEIDGKLFHANDAKTGREERKYSVAEKNGYRLIKIIETDADEPMRIEGNRLYIHPYENTSKAKKAEIISLVQELLPYEHSESLWDEAAVYMREWKNNVHKVEQSHPIRQYSLNGDLVAEYKNFDQIKNAIARGEAFGFKWEVI